MDYKQKYEELLQRANKVYSQPYVAGWDKNKELLEFLFPEFKVQSDEDVRLHIKALIEQSSDLLTKQNQDQMLSWLESHKEVYDEKDKSILKALRLCVKELKERHGWNYIFTEFPGRPETPIEYVEEWFNSKL